MLTPDQIQHFKTWGYLIIPSATTREFCDATIAFAFNELEKKIVPIEYESDIGYPGAPESRAENGGDTARRLLAVAGRHPMLYQWATGDYLTNIMRQLLGTSVYFSQSHHNCIMTKHPHFSSSTGWHRDSRYWNFARPELVSAWLALSDEQPENGCLWVLPGSHKWEIEPYQLDDNQFLRVEVARNRDLMTRLIPIILGQGDLLLFHSNLFHAAGCNTTMKAKFSLVFTYRACDNLPIRGTRSCSMPEIAL